MCITLYIQFGRELIANILSVATVISWLYLLKSMLGDFYSSLFHMFVLFNPSQLQSFILHCYSAVGLREWRLHVIRDCRGCGDNCTSGSAVVYFDCKSAMRNEIWLILAAMWFPVELRFSNVWFGNLIVKYFLVILVPNVSPMFWTLMVKMRVYISQLLCLWKCHLVWILVNCLDWQIQLLNNYTC